VFVSHTVRVPTLTMVRVSVARSRNMRLLSSNSRSAEPVCVAACESWLKSGVILSMMEALSETLTK
jgi:hypothetical protein